MAGRVLIAAGVLVLLFVVYQLWGTNLQEARSQDELRGQLPASVTEQAAGPSPTTTSVHHHDDAGRGRRALRHRAGSPAPADVPVPAERRPGGSDPDPADRRRQGSWSRA